MKFVSKEEREGIETELRRWRAVRGRRMKAFRELEAMVSEGLGLGKGELWVSFSRFLCVSLDLVLWGKRLIRC